MFLNLQRSWYNDFCRKFCIWWIQKIIYFFRFFTFPSQFYHNSMELSWSVSNVANHIIIPKLWHNTCPPNCGKNVMTMWQDKKISITISSHFYHNLTKKILWSSLALKDSYSTILFNKWSQSDKNVMKMWWLEISTYFLVRII